MCIRDSNKMTRNLSTGRLINTTTAFLILMLLGNPAFEQEVSNDTSNLISVKHGSKGFEFKTRDDRFLLQIQGRLQFRFATPDDQDPVTFDDFSGEKKPTFKINRARRCE